MERKKTNFKPSLENFDVHAEAGRVATQKDLAQLAEMKRTTGSDRLPGWATFPRHLIGAEKKWAEEVLKWADFVQIPVASLDELFAAMPAVAWLCGLYDAESNPNFGESEISGMLDQIARALQDVEDVRLLPDGRAPIGDDVDACLHVALDVLLLARRQLRAKSTSQRVFKVAKAARSKLWSTSIFGEILRETLESDEPFSQLWVRELLRGFPRDESKAAHMFAVTCLETIHTAALRATSEPIEQEIICAHNYATWMSEEFGTAFCDLKFAEMFEIFRTKAENKKAQLLVGRCYQTIAAKVVMAAFRKPIDKYRFHLRNEGLLGPDGTRRWKSVWNEPTPAWVASAKGKWFTFPLSSSVKKAESPKSAAKLLADEIGQSCRKRSSA